MTKLVDNLSVVEIHRVTISGVLSAGVRIGRHIQNCAHTRRTLCHGACEAALALPSLHLAAFRCPTSFTSSS